VATTAAPAADDGHQLVGIGRREAQWDGIDVREALEEERLALHHRERCPRPEVTETKHGGVVADDGHRVAPVGVEVDAVRMGGDLRGDQSHVRGVGEREVGLVVEAHLGGDLDLAAAG
jgi:hypothetical protein